VARVKDRDQPISIEVGNGIENSWRGYFSHSSPDAVLQIEKRRLLPLEETLGGTTLRYGDWKEVEPGKWVPGLVDVLHGETRYQMRFEWMGEAVWLLTQADSISRDGRTTVARTEQVVVNAAPIVSQPTEQQGRSREAAQAVRGMLERNTPWLRAGVSNLDSI
jgi:hypothetical protein